MSSYVVDGDPEVSDAELSSLAFSLCLRFIVDPPDRVSFNLADRILRSYIRRWELEPRPTEGESHVVSYGDFRGFLDEMKERYRLAGSGDVSPHG